MDSLKMGLDPAQMVDEYNVLIYLINSVLHGINTIEVVRVQEVNEELKRIAVIPIVKSANASGNPIPESPIFNVKYIQWQYGTNIIRAAPAVGDVGIIVVCKKDISSIESGIVGSFREFSLSDGIYIGGLFGFNVEPTQIIEFTDAGITVTTPKTLTINATESVVVNTTKNTVVNATEDVTINGVNVTVNASAKADVIAPQVNLGASGGVAVAKDGDPVMAGSTVVGTIKASSTVVKTI